MAIAFDTSTDGGTTGTGTLTFAHTCTGSDLILIVGAHATSGSDEITGATYNSVSMTLVDKVQTSGDWWNYMFFLVAPATGANNVVISSSGTGIAGTASSFTGVGAIQPDAKTTNTANSTTIATSVTTVADNAWSAIVSRNNNGTTTAGAGTVVRQGPGGGYGIADSNSATTPPGTDTLNLVTGSTAQWGVVMMSFGPPSTFTPKMVMF